MKKFCKKRTLLSSSHKNAQELSKILNPDHPLFQLSQQIPWESLRVEFSELYSSSGRRAASVRLMVSLLILKHLHDLGDETVLQAWVENPYFQYFSGESYFQWTPPIDPSDFVKFRQRIGEDGVEKILKISIELHGERAKEAEVLVDTTVQEKNITFPTDTKLYHRIIEYCWRIAEEQSVQLRQSYRRILKKLMLAQRFRKHPKNYKKALQATRKIKTIAGRLVRELERKLPQEIQLGLNKLLETFHRVLIQRKKDASKIYSIHEPQIYCMTKGQDHKKYEFGTKVSITQTKTTGVIVGALSFPQNCYDGKTLPEVLTQTAFLVGKRPQAAIVDRGYRGKTTLGEKQEVRVEIPASPSPKATASQKQKAQRKFRRRAAIEPCIGHLKSDFRLSRNFYHGSLGDAIHVMLAAVAWNCKLWMRKQMKRMITQNPTLRPLVGSF